MTRSTSWKMDCTMMLRHITDVISGLSRPVGFCSMSSSRGGSVASASAPMVSMIKFTHSNCTVVSGALPVPTAAMKLSERATRFTVNWNWTNFWMLEYTERPHRTTVTMEAKLSSRMMMSELLLATSVPAMPIARPMSASFKARASFVPSPVTPTTSPSPRSMCTRSYLSVGDERAITCSFSSLGPYSAMRSLYDILRKVLPSTASPMEVRMLHSRAIAFAVITLSPVTMRTTMPAF
mmetsp:Transcript_11369/g.19423  ORF Transcript_11369/g.19423 Transcript_11369/m.19423 type:complete len:237 (-) Transcript_11369:2424-3134(-)